MPVCGRGLVRSEAFVLSLLPFSEADEDKRVWAGQCLSTPVSVAGLGSPLWGCSFFWLLFFLIFSAARGRSAGSSSYPQQTEEVLVYSPRGGKEGSGYEINVSVIAIMRLVGWLGEVADVGPYRYFAAPLCLREGGCPSLSVRLLLFPDGGGETQGGGCGA
ncbi:hypothetical protein NDU88_005919 [Pleurodeles waltl]|uniref:Uncharacterized protein n=1 Tax=Pleurodeles waltl TaxID=8319 RepID=A0AAV7SN32_PLEWA|nr:hypothetical protein NDU88_005919 [Pleurodeles waltl]